MALRSEPREIEVELSAFAVEVEITNARGAPGSEGGVEVPDTPTVDGDYNGAPALEALDATGDWQGADALDAMEGRDAQEQRDTDEPVGGERLAEAIAGRREVLAERMDEARELGLGAVFEAALAVSEPEAGNSPVVVDDGVLRDQLVICDLAIEYLERRSTAGELEAR